MKQNIAKVLTFSLLATSAVFISCVDNEKNLFDAEQLRQIYEETFPVKNIDPDGDWTMSRSVTAHVTVNGDLGEDYPIRIFDANPLSPESLSYYKENEMQPGDNPPVGILLCTRKGKKMVEYALAGMDNQLFVSTYMLQLPDRKTLEDFLLKQLGE